MQVIPLFRTHYSVGKSILTLDIEMAEGGSDSALLIAKEEGLKEVFIVDENLSGALEAKRNCETLDLKLIFGLRIVCVSQSEFKTKDEFEKNCAKYIIFCKNSNGYKRLIKLYSLAATTGLKFDTPTLNFDILKKNWSDDDLLLAIPFYDSYIDVNRYYFGTHIEDLFFTKKVVFLVEDNELFFDLPLKQAVLDEIENRKSDFESIEKWDAKTIYYKMKEDFEALQVRKCIHSSGRRSTLDSPGIPHLHSSGFSFESWREQNGKK